MTDEESFIDDEADELTESAIHELEEDQSGSASDSTLSDALSMDPDSWSEDERIEFERQIPMQAYGEERTVDISMRRYEEFPVELLRNDPDSIVTIAAYGNSLGSLPNQITRLQNLSLLDVSGNKLTELPRRIGHISGLYALEANENKIEELPESLFYLVNLGELALAGNRLESISDKIGRLKSINTLNLSHNELKDLPDSIGELKNLESISLSGNNISRLPVTIGNLRNLKFANLSENSLRSLPPTIQWLQSLEELHLSANELKILPSQIGKLRNLRNLDLSYNSIMSLPPELGKLSRLEHLDLSGNEIRTLPKELGNLPENVTIDFSGNPLAEPLPSLISRGIPALLTYLRSLGDGTPHYEAKVLLVGEGGVGKSSLIAALRGDDFIRDRPTTHGIEINGLTLDHPQFNQDLILNSWDFGGQEVYRITHQFFFSKRALYLIVWKPREGHEENNVEAWCRRIRLRVGDHARILIVATHSDERRPEFDYEYLKEKFPNLLVGYHAVDSESGRGLDELRTSIADEASKLPQMGELISKSWLEARDEILQMDGPQISRMKFERICSVHDLDEAETETLSSLLHDLGHIIHYSDDDGLRDIIVLQPEWLTKAIGYVLEDETTRTNGGVLEHSNLRGIWADNDDDRIKYDPKLHPYFLRLMEKFDVSYRLSGDTASLVAQLVPYERPKSIWQDTAPGFPGRRRLQAVCRTAEEAPGLIAWLTVRNHRFSAGQHWRRGVVLEYKKYASQAVFELAENNRDLRLTVIGPAPDYFFHILKDGIDELVQLRWRGLSYDFLIPCTQIDDNAFCRGLFPLNVLQKFRERGEPRIICNTCANWSEVNTLLTGFGRLAAPLDQLLEGMKNISTKLLSIEASSSETARYTRTVLKVLSLEVIDCPRLFTLTPADRSKVVDALSIKENYKMVLWCEEPGGEHPREEASYTFKPPKGWLQNVAPYIRYLTKFLRIAVPIGVTAYATSMSDEALRHAKADLDLMKILAEKLPEDPLDSQPTRNAMTKLQGSALRAFRILLTKLDTEAAYGDLRRTLTPAGDYLWVCPEHYSEYDPGLPTI